MLLLRSRLFMVCTLAIELASLLHLSMIYGDLPAVLASHFDAEGRVNGAQSKFAFACFVIAEYACLTLLFWALPRLLHKLPSRFINLPNRSYWLAPERRDASLARLTVFMDCLGAGTLTLLAASFECVLLANLPGGAFPAVAMLVLVVAFLIATIVGTSALMRNFRLPANAVRSAQGGGVRPERDRAV